MQIPIDTWLNDGVSQYTCCCADKEHSLTPKQQDWIDKASPLALALVKIKLIAVAQDSQGRLDVRLRAVGQLHRIAVNKERIRQ